MTTALHVYRENRQIWNDFARHSRTFSFAARLLPFSVQVPVATLYLYCRHVDTIADHRVTVVGAEQALRELDALEAKLTATLAGRPPNVLLWRRLADVHARYDLADTPLRQLIDGARWDLEGRTVETEADLLHYADLVGGCVGAMMLAFLSADAPRATLEPTARALGQAMQYTNILRDVGEDLHLLDRVYLPRTLLDAHGLTRDDLSASTPPPGYRNLVEHLMAQAEALYDEAMSGVQALNGLSRVGILAAARLYREIMNEVRANGYDNLQHRAFVPLPRKVARLARDSYGRRRARLLA